MTQRTEGTKITAIEAATQDIKATIRSAVYAAHANYHLPLDQVSFARIVALHLHDLSEEQWFRITGAPSTTGDRP